MTNVTVVDDRLGAATLSDDANDGVGFLAAGDTETATLAYVVEPVDLGTDIVNVATADSTQTGPDTDTNTVPVPTPSLTIAKDAVDVGGDGPDGEADEAGDIIEYDIIVTNNGTANLTNVTVDHDLTGTVDASCSAFLMPGESCTVMVTYTVTQADLDDNGANPTSNEFIDNTAMADSVQTDPLSDSEQVPVVQAPAHTLDKEFQTAFDPDQIGEGETGTFELVYTNTGNVTLSDAVITDAVDPRLVVGTITSSEATCTVDVDQLITCTADADLAPGDSVTITVEFVALGEALLPSVPGQTSGATYVVFFDNGYVLCGSTALEPSDPDWATLLDENRDSVTGWSVVGANQDIFLTVPYGGGADDGFTLHLSCSEPYIDGWGATGPIEGEDDDDWRVISYTVERFNTNGLFKDCKQTFTFDVVNTASATATPAGGTSIRTRSRPMTP